jgi:hypothetical protein
VPAARSPRYCPVVFDAAAAGRIDPGATRTAHSVTRDTVTTRDLPVILDTTAARQRDPHAAEPAAKSAGNFTAIFYAAAVRQADPRTTAAATAAATAAYDCAGIGDRGSRKADDARPTGSPRPAGDYAVIGDSSPDY